jgi:hypothetical protein
MLIATKTRSPMTEMTEEQALAAVEEGLVSDQSLAVKLRGGDGLDVAMLQRTKEALAVLRELYRGRDVVPKRLAFATVDLLGTLTSGNYPDDVWYQMEVACEELVALAYSIFEPDRA